MLVVPNLSLAAFAGVALVLLTACGFHLRAGVELPAVLENTYLQSQSLYSGIATELRLELQSAGADLTDQRDQATGVVNILNERSQQRVLSVGSAGRASEYELFEEVSFALEDPQGNVLLEPQTLRMTRDLVFDDTQLLGKVGEAEVIRRQMQRDLARQIITRITVGMRPR
jgi:LPS-assembly lipoprotein